MRNDMKAPPGAHRVGPEDKRQPSAMSVSSLSDLGRAAVGPGRALELKAVGGYVTTSIDDRPRCRRCRHPLTSHLAVEAGFGPTCAMYILGNAPRRARERFIGQATLPGLEMVGVRRG